MDRRWETFAEEHCMKKLSLRQFIEKNNLSIDDPDLLSKYSQYIFQVWDHNFTLRSNWNEGVYEGTCDILRSAYRVGLSSDVVERLALEYGISPERTRQLCEEAQAEKTNSKGKGM